MYETEIINAGTGPIDVVKSLRMKTCWGLARVVEGSGPKVNDNVTLLAVAVECKGDGVLRRMYPSEPVVWLQAAVDMAIATGQALGTFMI